MKIDKTLIGIRIKLKRKEHGLSQEELAEKIGFSKNHLSGIECGKNTPTLPFLFAICNALGETLDYYALGHSTDTTDKIDALIRGLPENHQTIMLNIIECYISSISNND